MVDKKISVLTITLNCMVAGIIAGALFSILLSALVLLIAGTGNTTLSETQRDNVPAITRQHAHGVSAFDNAATTNSHIQWLPQRIRGNGNTSTML